MCQVYASGMRMPDGLAHTAEANGSLLRAAIYDRVSKDTTGRQRSVQEQEEANLKACTAKGWAVTDDDIFTDNDRSASRFATKSRPDWARLREDLVLRKYHVVVLWEVSRGDRDDLEWIGFLRKCREIGIFIHITSDGHTYDVRKRRDYKTLAEEGLGSADESEKTSERIVRDVESAALKGMPHGFAPYGYGREYEVDAHGQRQIVAQVPDDVPCTSTAEDGSTVSYTRAGIVKEIIRRLLAGETTQGIAADLNWRGIPSPRGGGNGWIDTTVRYLAKNPTYAGKRVHHGRAVADAIWPPLISKSDHHALARRFSDSSRRTQRDSRIKHLGSGLYVCGVCGSTVRTVKKDYGRAYVCWPKKVIRKSERTGRKVTEEELATLRPLGRRAQTSRILDLFEAGVTQTSMAAGLGINRSTLSVRLMAERERRGIVKADPAKRPLTEDEAAKHYHVTRPLKDVDDYVQWSVWFRLARPDIAEILAEDARADERMEALGDEIAEKQLRLDEARDAYAAGAGLSLEALLRIEAQLDPEIKKARARLDEARVGPVLRGLVHPTVDAIAEEWAQRGVSQQREVIRVLIDRVEIRPIGGGRRRVTIEDSVRIIWRQPRREPRGG